MQTDHLRNNYLQLGVAACKAGLIDQAARFLEAGLQESERLNLKDLRTAGLLYNLAVVYYRKGLREEVESLLLRCLRLCRQHVACEHPASKLVLRLLASYYFQFGNLTLARYYCRQILKKQSLKPAEQVGYLMRLATIEKASSHPERVQDICKRIYALQKDQYAMHPANCTAAPLATAVI